MNKEDVINLCYYFSCEIFALDHCGVEISTHWPNGSRPLIAGGI
jgi:hypothetical protein